MKKIFTILGTMLLGGSVFAQGAADALLFSEVQYEGTARTMAMGNAFIALGGDIGALSVNPASSGIYRCCEFAVSPSFITAGADAMFNGSSVSDRSTRMALSNCGFVTTLETGRSNGLISFNYGFTSNRIKSFNSLVSASGYNSSSSLLGAIASGLEGIPVSLLEKTDTYEPYDNSDLYWNEILAYDTYLIDPISGSSDSYIGATENTLSNGRIATGGKLYQDYYKKTTGGIHQIAFNLGTNFNDKFYAGANINFNVVEYNINEYYSETAPDSQVFDDGMTQMHTGYLQETEGLGLNAQLGFIWTPGNGFRLGATYTTPTWYSLTDRWSRSMASEFDNGNSYNQTSPDGYYEYQVTSPGRLGVGAAYILGNLGLISADYETVNYGNIRMADNEGRKSAFSDANAIIGKSFNRTDNFRVGGEVWLGTTALRAGYNWYGSAGTLCDTDGSPIHTYNSASYLSYGIGFKLNSDGRTLLDIAYQKMIDGQSETTYIYGDYGDGKTRAAVKAPAVSAQKSLSKLVMTLAFRF